METKQLKIKRKYQNKILILVTIYDNDHHSKAVWGVGLNVVNC